MPIFQLMLVIFSSLTRIVNVRYLLRIRHIVRIAWNTLFIIAGFVLMAIGTSAT
jgi:hypothetical protein